MQFFKTKLGQHLLSIIIIFIVGAFYFLPALSGFDVRMGDVDNAKGLSAINEFIYNVKGYIPMWSSHAFAGMPSYYIWMPLESTLLNNIISPFFKFFGLGLGGFLILAFGYLVFMNAIQKSPLLATAGALLFAFTTYFIIVLDAGHFNKVYASGAFPFLFAGVVHLVKDRKWMGWLLSLFGFAFAIISNHPQITYYFGWILGAYGIYELVKAIRSGESISFIKKMAILIPFAGLAVAVNLENLYKTTHYTQYSTRGGNDIETAETSDGGGLDIDYITQWSYGVDESWNLMVPGLKGGGSRAMGNMDAVQNADPRFRQNIAQSSLYWGNQPFTAGPAYMGIVNIILFIFGLVFVRNQFKWVLLGISLLAIGLAMGKNFMGLTEFFVNNFPLYNKFRSVTMIHVIVQFCLPFLGILFLSDLVEGKIELKQKPLTIASASILGLLGMFYVAGGSLFEFISDQELNALNQQGASDPNMRMAISQYISELESVRVSILKSSVLRTMGFAILAIGLIWAYFKKAIKPQQFIIAIAIVGVVDLVLVDRDYLNSDKTAGRYEHYIEKDSDRLVFPPSQYDNQILQMELQANPQLAQVVNQVQLEEKGGKDAAGKLLQKKLLTLSLNSNYRVMNLARSTFNDASTSYYHKSVGGYHGAKTRKIQNMINTYLSRPNPNSDVFNSFNVKYLITQQGVQQNPNAFGPAWMVSSLTFVENTTAEYDTIGSLPLRSTAAISTQFQSELSGNYDANRAISQTVYGPDTLSYSISNGQKGFAVLSELYYPEDWKATFNGQEIPVYQVNYWQRGVEIPAGEGELTLVFEPTEFRVYAKIALVSNIVFFLFLILFGWNCWKKKSIQ